MLMTLSFLRHSLWSLYGKKMTYIKIVAGCYSFIGVAFVDDLCRENIPSITAQYDLSTGNIFLQSNLLVMVECP